jgi:hypothetical protein
MANGNQQQQQQGRQRPGTPDMPAVRTAIVDDDYSYEIKPFPKGPDQGRARNPEEWPRIVDAVTSGIDNSV